MFRCQVVLRLQKDKNTFLKLIRKVQSDNAKSSDQLKELYEEGKKVMHHPGEVLELYLTKSNNGKGSDITENDLRECMRYSQQKKNTAIRQYRGDTGMRIVAVLVNAIRLYVMRYPNAPLKRSTVSLAAQIIGSNSLTDIISLYRIITTANATSNNPQSVSSVVPIELFASVLHSMSKSNKRSSHALVGVLLQYARHKVPLSGRICTSLLHDCMKRRDSKAARYWWKIFEQNPDTERSIALSYYIRSLPYHIAVKEFKSNSMNIPVGSSFYQHFLLCATTIHEVNDIYANIPTEMRNLATARAKLMSLATLKKDPEFVIDVISGFKKDKLLEMRNAALLAMGISILFRFNGPEEWLQSEALSSEILTYWKSLISGSKPEWRIVVLDSLIQRKYPTDLTKDQTERALLEKHVCVQKAISSLIGVPFDGKLKYDEMGFHNSFAARLYSWLGFTPVSFEFGGLGARRLHDMYLHNLRAAPLIKVADPPLISVMPSVGDSTESLDWVGPPISDSELNLKLYYPIGLPDQRNHDVPPPPNDSPAKSRIRVPRQRSLEPETQVTRIENDIPPPIEKLSSPGIEQGVKPRVPPPPVVRPKIFEQNKRVLPPAMQSHEPEDLGKSPAIRKFIKQRENCLKAGGEQKSILRSYTAAFTSLSEKDKKESLYLLKQFSTDNSNNIVKGDCVFYTSVLQYLQRVNDYNGVLIVWNRIREQSLKPDEKLLTVILHACTAAAVESSRDSIWSTVARQAWDTYPIRGFRLYTRYMHFLSTVGDVVQAENLFLSSPKVRSLGGKLCPYLIDHFEAAYTRRGLSHDEIVNRMKHLLVHKTPLAMKED